MKVRTHLTSLVLLGALATGTAAPFVPVNATYNGLFFETNGFWENSSGTISIKSTSKGSYSGSVQVGTSRYSFSGRFDPEGWGVEDILRRYREPLRLEFQVTPEDPDIIYGILTDGTWVADMYADRAVYDGKVNVSPDAGQYTMIIPGEITSNENPGGDSYCTITIDKAGRLRCAGSLADGKKFSQSTTVSKGGQWPLYAPLYSGYGSLYGWMLFNSSVESDLEGDVTWIKPATPKDVHYPKGFAITVSSWGSYYARPPKGAPILDLTTATIEFVGGGLDRSITNSIVLDPNNRVTNLSANKLSLSFSTANGTFTGRVMHPVTWNWLSFRGVVMQKFNVAAGYFVNWAETGEVWLQER